MKNVCLLGLSFLAVTALGFNSATAGGGHHSSGHHSSGYRSSGYRSSGHHGSGYSNQYITPYAGGYNSGHHNQYVTPHVPTYNSGHHGQYVTPYVPTYNSGHHNQVVTPHVPVYNSGHHNQFVTPHGSSHVLPYDTHSSGTYYTQGGNNYYYPQTASVGDVHTTQYQPQQIQFGGFSQVDDLSGRLETMANDFCLDLHHNYSHNRDFKAVYREAYQILETAKFIHTAKHQHDHKAIQERLSSLDKLAHHVQSEVTGWSRNHHQQIGQLKLLDKITHIQTNLHHLMNDTGVKPTSVNTGGHH